MTAALWGDKRCVTFVCAVVFVYGIYEGYRTDRLQTQLYDVETAATQQDHLVNWVSDEKKK